MTRTVKTHSVHELKHWPMVCAKTPNEALKIRVLLCPFGLVAQLTLHVAPPSVSSDPRPSPFAVSSALLLLSSYLQFLLSLPSKYLAGWLSLHPDDTL